MSDRRRRTAVRALLMDPEDGAVLLLRARFPGWKRARWLTPGGGMDAGESPEESLVREIHEETRHRISSSDIVAGPIWTRRVEYQWQDVHFEQFEHFYLVHTARFEPDAGGNPAAYETAALEAFGWWTAAAMDASDEQFIPRALAGHLPPLVRGELPATPYDIGL
jgi:8-oxo-dGTP pyrophosphatase MutT (NUDIX family)